MLQVISRKLPILRKSVHYKYLPHPVSGLSGRVSLSVGCMLHSCLGVEWSLVDVASPISVAGAVWVNGGPEISCSLIYVLPQC